MSSVPSIDGPGRSRLRVELRYAPLPGPLGLIAVHHWFVLFDAGETERWEVWQRKGAGGQSWGHLHRNLMHPDRGVGGGPMVHLAAWEGEAARDLAAVLRAPERYPFRDRYCYWPGPNSNTYAAWVLREAGIPQPLHARGWGGRYRLLLPARAGPAWQPLVRSAGERPRRPQPRPLPPASRQRDSGR